MWTFEYSVTTGAKPEVVWKLWTDADQMSNLASVASLKAKDRIAPGAKLTLRVRGSPPLKATVTDVDEGRRISVEARMPGTIIRTHRLPERLDDGGRRLTERLEVDGPASRLVRIFFGEMVKRTIRKITDDAAETAGSKQSAGGHCA